jgi:hypothetical protein
MSGHNTRNKNKRPRANDDSSASPYRAVLKYVLPRIAFFLPFV